MKHTTNTALTFAALAALLTSCNGSALDLSGLNVKLPGQDVTAHWQSPANYARTPIGQNPVNPITLSADFSDQSGCPNKTYRFWLFSKDGGTPLSGIGSNAELPYDNHFEQVVSLPIDVPVYQIRLACTKANGDRYANSDILETGNPAFTPRYAVAWQNPEGYVRSPSGNQPTNPITLSVNFSDENGCPYQMYRFWSYSLNGTPVGPLGDIMTLTPGSGVTTTATLPANVPVNAVRLACVDTEGNLYESTANLEIGNPAFTPKSSGTCSGQNTTLCAAPSTSETCSTCGGNWTLQPQASCVGTPGQGNGCTTFNTEESCAQRNEEGGILANMNAPICYWTGSSCEYVSDLCTKQDTQTKCWNAGPNYGFGNCTWVPTPEGTCSGGQTSGGIAACATQTSQTSCESFGLLDGNGTQIFESSYCQWNGSSCALKTTVCTDQDTSIRCDYVASGGYGACSWAPTPAGTCSGVTPNFCTSPQNEAACTTCGGTWTTN